MSQATIRVIDTETTGLDPSKDKIVEIAWMDIFQDHEGWKCGESFSDLIDPGIPIPPESSAIHHIVDADVEGRPLIEKINWRFDSIYAAHNASFDRSFLGGLQEDRWICTRKCAMFLWPDAPAHSNQVLRYWLRLRLPAWVHDIMPHRALHDVGVTACLLIRILKEMEIARALEISSQPALLPKCHFGKHRGKPWKEVPKDYMQWCLRQDMDEDVKHTCRHWINNNG